MNEIETNKVTGKDNVLEILHFNFLVTVVMGIFGLSVRFLQEKFGFFTYPEGSFFSGYQYDIESQISNVFGASIVEVVVFTAIFAAVAYYLAKGYKNAPIKASNPVKKIISIVLTWVSGLIIFATFIDILNKLVIWDFKKQDILISVITFVLFATVFLYEYFRYKRAVDEKTVTYTLAFIGTLVVLAIASIVSSILVFGTPAKYNRVQADKATYSSISLGEADVHDFIKDKMYSGAPALPADTQEMGKFIFPNYKAGSKDTDLGYTYKLTQQITSIPSSKSFKKTYTDGSYSICVNFKESYTKKDESDTYDSHPAGEYCKSFTVTASDLEKLSSSSYGSGSSYNDDYNSNNYDTMDSQPQDNSYMGE